MTLYEKIGDQAIALTQQYRKTDPRLAHPIKGTLSRLAEWAFPDALFRASTKIASFNKTGSLRDENAPNDKNADARPDPSP